MDIKSVDIIFVNYNSTEFVINSIKSIHKFSENLNFNIIVFDNNSNDFPLRIKKYYPTINLICNERNIGFARAVNFALKMATSEIILLLNPDTRICYKLFSDILRYISENKNVAIVGPKIIEPNGEIQGSARRFPTAWTSIFGRKSPITKLFPNNSITKKEFICFSYKGTEPIEVDWVSGACMIARKKALDHVKGFDEKFFLYWEDTDLCKRLKDNGWHIIYYPSARIIHHVGKSSNTKPIFSTYHFHRSCFYLFLKHAKFPATLLHPIAFLGLSFRCFIVICIQFGNNIFRTIKKVTKINDKRLNTNLQKFVWHHNFYQNEKGVADFHYLKRIKVLRIVSRLNIGGPSIHCSILTTGLNSERFITKLVKGEISSFEGDMSYLLKNCDDKLINIPELQREIEPWKDVKAFFKIACIIFKNKPDIVHTHLAKAGALSRAAVIFLNMISKNKIKTVHTYHGHVLDGYFGNLKSQLFILIERGLAKFTDAIIAISSTQKWELSKKYKIAGKEKIHMINLGFDLARFLKPYKSCSVRKSLGIADDEVLIGIIGRLVPIKNHFLFLDAARLIKNKLSSKSVRFIIVGDGELLNELQTYAIQLGIHNEVFFYGWEKDIQKIYSELDILVLTSNNEGTPVSIIESMAASVPVVTTGVGGIKDLLGPIDHGYCGQDGFTLCERGILCPKENAAAIANGIIYLIENDNLDRVTKAKEFVLQNYTDKRLIQKIENLYENLISK